MTRFVPGQTIVTREVWRGSVWAVRPMRVVSDDDHLALWFPRGTRWLHPAALDGGRIRVPTEPWKLVEDAWHLDDNLILVRDGDAHAVHLFFAPDGAQKGWYVNLQEPIRRTAQGYDFMDQQLDIVASADLREIAWKDEDDFAEFATLIGPAAAAAVRAEGEAVIDRMHARAWPFDGSFAAWRADPSWGGPALVGSHERVQDAEPQRRYVDVLPELRASYDAGAGERDVRGEALPPWKLAEREAFLRRLHEEGKQRLLEVGAGTGHDSLFFRDAGLTVVATDLSPEMVARCRAKGLDAHQADFLSLPFDDATFDAVYAMNCLLHVPNADLPDVLAAIADVLAPGGLFFLGVYGGNAAERYAENDTHVPKRFFASRTDEEIQRFAAERFEIVDFHVVHPGGGHVIDPDTRFQSLTLRRPSHPHREVAVDAAEV